MVWTYTVWWEQNMGGGRGISMNLQFTDWETGKFVWGKLCKNKLPNEVRGVKTSVSKISGEIEEFNPEEIWPRPPFILP
jgi:hypothetical protein